MKEFIAVFVFLLSSFLSLGCLSEDASYRPKTNKELIAIAVKITNLAQTSGGTGFVFSSDEKGSIVLTNAHVCRLLEVGGVMEDSRHMKYLISPKNVVMDVYHDLCAIKMQHNWHIALKLAKHDVEAGDELTVVGFPALMPVMITKGIASEKMIISVVDGVRTCTEEEKTAPETGLICMFNNGLPVVIQREAQLMSNLIMGGSSGSPVFNKKGELQSVIFAGRGELSFSLAVPWDYLKSFTDRLNAL